MGLFRTLISIEQHHNYYTTIMDISDLEEGKYISEQEEPAVINLYPSDDEELLADIDPLTPAEKERASTAPPVLPEPTVKSVVTRVNNGPVAGRNYLHPRKRQRTEYMIRKRRNRNRRRRASRRRYAIAAAAAAAYREEECDDWTRRFGYWFDKGREGHDFPDPPTIVDCRTQEFDIDLRQGESIFSVPLTNNLPVDTVLYNYLNDLLTGKAPFLNHIPRLSGKRLGVENLEESVAVHLLYYFRKFVTREAVEKYKEWARDLQENKPFPANSKRRSPTPFLLRKDCPNSIVDDYNAHQWELYNINSCKTYQDYLRTWEILEYRRVENLACRS